MIALLLWLSTAWAGEKCVDKTPHDSKGKRAGVQVYCWGNGGREETTYANDLENGPKRTYSFEGKLEKEVNYKDGKIDGPAKEWHRNGKLAAEMVYKEYKLNGVKKIYYENGTLKEEGRYAADEYDGPRRTFFGSGKRETEGNYRAGKKNGTETTYWENSNKRSIANFADGARDGEQREFGENGKIASVDHLKQGKRQGWRLEYHDNSYGHYLHAAEFNVAGERKLYGTFHANGKINEVTCYKDGNASEDRGSCRAEIDGLAKLDGVNGVEKAKGDSGQFFADGKPRVTCPQKNGKRHGKCVWYLENGTVQQSGEYRDGLRVGVHVENFSDGKPSKKRHYEKDELVRVEEFFPEGEVKQRVEVRKGREIASTTFFQNGSPQTQIAWEGEKQHLRQYHDNGQLAVEARLVPTTNCGWYCYQSHEYDGTVRRYREDGSLYEEGDWKSGKRVGLHRSFHENGKPSSEAIYKEDRLATLKQFDDDGRLTSWDDYFPDGSKKAHKVPNPKRRAPL